ncbi:CoA transferase [Micrococcaceae bacterium Sec5.1]
MILADVGAEVIGIRPATDTDDAPRDPALGGRRVTSANLKDAEDVRAVRELARHADVLLEGFDRRCRAAGYRPCRID